MKILVANGDSHTSGSYPGSPTLYNKETAWSAHIANAYEAQHLNVAESGAGCDQIGKSTIVTVGSLIELKKVEPSNIIVFVLWTTGTKRYEFWNDAEERHQSVGVKTSWSPSEEFSQYAKYRDAVESDEYTMYKDLYTVYNTALVLEAYGVRYQFMNSNTTFVEPSTPSVKKIYDNVLSLYGKRRDRHIGFNKPEDLYFNYLKTKVEPFALGGKKKTTPYWAAEGHKEYAKFLLKII